MAYVVCSGPAGQVYPHLQLDPGQLVTTWGDLRRLVEHPPEGARDEMQVWIEDAGQGDGRGGCRIFPLIGASISIVEDLAARGDAQLLLGIDSQPDGSPELVQAERELRKAADRFSQVLDAEKEARAARDATFQRFGISPRPTDEAILRAQAKGREPREQAANEQTQAARVAFMHSVFGVPPNEPDTARGEPAHYPDVSGGGVPYSPEPAHYPDEHQIGAGENLED